MNGSRRAHRHAVALGLVLVSTSALAMPQLVWAGSGAPSGGGGLGAVPGGKVPSQKAAGAPGVVQPGNVTVTASGNGITLSARAATLLRNQLRFTGSVSQSAAGQVVEIERLGRQTGWTWMPTTHGVVAANGAFSAVWPTNHIGRFSIRAVIRGSKTARSAGSSPAVTITVYRPAIATLYGPGFYGQSTACGETLKQHTLGVANRTLPCGTLVSIYYQGRTIVVPVIDRGPYANHADWDLTEATGSALGMNGTATVGAVSLPAK